jgi:septal ring factor EnvC (AmiA/AmiB activator)
MNNTATATIDDNIRAEHAAIDARAAKAKESQAQLGKLQQVITRCETALVEFEAKKSFFEQRKQQLKSQVTTLWSQKRGDLSLQLNFDPLLGIVESHGTILAIDAALADAPRAKKYLDAELAAARQRLAQFERQPK